MRESVRTLSHTTCQITVCTDSRRKRRRLRFVCTNSSPDDRESRLLPLLKCTPFSGNSASVVRARHVVIVEGMKGVYIKTGIHLLKHLRTCYFERHSSCRQFLFAEGFCLSISASVFSREEPHFHGRTVVSTFGNAYRRYNKRVSIKNSTIGAIAICLSSTSVGIMR